MNEKFFNQINSNNVAYWIGFIAADGTISVSKNKLGFGLSSKDKVQLEKFKITINNENVITERNTLCTNGKYYPSCYLNIYSKQIVSDLLKYGIEERKSYKDIDFLSYIPDEYKFSFICGLFDGDGWFCNTEKSKSFGICGSEKNIKSVASFLKNSFNWDKLEPHKDSTSKSTFYLQTSAKGKLLDFINAYLDLECSCDLLERKVLIAKDLKQQILISNAQKQQKQQNKVSLKKAIVCPICNKAFVPFKPSKQKYCGYECAQKAQRRVERPSRDEFKQLIRTTPFTTIGKQFGLSDNAIRKWCDSYNLPRKVSDIKKYSDEEWNKL